MYAKDSMRIHIDVPAAMTGVSRFGEIYSPHWQYSKEEKTDEIDMTSFDYVLTSTPELYLKGVSTTRERMQNHKIKPIFLENA